MFAIITASAIVMIFLIMAVTTVIVIRMVQDDNYNRRIQEHGQRLQEQELRRQVMLQEGSKS